MCCANNNNNNKKTKQQHGERRPRSHTIIEREKRVVPCAALSFIVRALKSRHMGHLLISIDVERKKKCYGGNKKSASKNNNVRVYIKKGEQLLSFLFLLITVIFIIRRLFSSKPGQQFFVSLTINPLLVSLNKGKRTRFLALGNLFTIPLEVSENF